MSLKPVGSCSVCQPWPCKHSAANGKSSRGPTLTWEKGCPAVWPYNYTCCWGNRRWLLQFTAPCECTHGLFPHWTDCLRGSFILKPRKEIPWFELSPRAVIAGAIPRSLWLQAQVTANLSWCHKSRLCTLISVFLQSEQWKCQYCSAYVASTIMWLRQEGRKFCEIHAESSQAKWQGFCWSNPPIRCPFQCTFLHFPAVIYQFCSYEFCYGNDKRFGLFGACQRRLQTKPQKIYEPGVDIPLLRLLCE